MAYTIDKGFRERHGLDRVQRALLVGLPALILLLVVGALINQGNPASGPAGQSAKTIPIVSSLSHGNGKPDSGNNSGNTPSNSSPATGGSTVAASSAPKALSTAAFTGSSSSSAPLVGGRGGGPTGGTTSSGGTTSGGGTLLPDCSLDQIATVTCQVPACGPGFTISPGQKAILGATGTCIIIN